MLSSSDAESVATADLLALEPDASERLLAQRLGYTESVGAPELRAAIAPIYETAVARRRRRRRGGGGGHLRRLPRAPRAGRPRGRRDALLRVGAPGRALGRGDGDRVAALGERRLGARPRRSPSARCGRTRSSSTSTARTTRRERRCRGRCSTRVVELCAERGAWLFSDEVYRELEHDPADRLPAACDLYERALSLGSMSKTYGLPGLRLGWLACRDRDALQRIVDLKHYTTICSSAPSELLSALALRHRDVLADRNRGIVLANLPLLDAFFERHARRCSPGCDRRPARSDSRGCTGRTTRPRSASSWSPPRACSCFPAPSTTSRATSASASAGLPCPRRWSGSSASSTHVLNPAEATSQPGRKVSEHPADTPWCRQHDSLEEGRCNG